MTGMTGLFGDMTMGSINTERKVVYAAMLTSIYNCMIA